MSGNEKTKVSLITVDCVGDSVTFTRNGERTTLEIAKVRRWVSLKGTDISFIDGSRARLKWSQTVNLTRLPGRPDLIDHTRAHADNGRSAVPMTARLTKVLSLPAARVNAAHIGSTVEFSTSAAIVYGRLDEVGLPVAGFKPLVIDGAEFSIDARHEVRILPVGHRVAPVASRNRTA